MTLKSILETAVRAPSGDNCQPWHLRVTGHRVDLFNLPERDDSLFNFGQRASLIAHGALIENILIASAAKGYRADITILPSGDDENHIASIGLEEAPAKDDPLYPWISRRQTNRRPYRPVPLTGSQRDALPASADTFPSCRVTLCEGAEQKKLCAVAALSDRIVFENRRLHAFLFDHVRWTVPDAEESRDGLDLRTLELSLPDRIGFRLLSHWSAARMLKPFGVTRVVAKQAGALCASASAAGLVTTENNGREGFLTAGRAVQRLWLEATRLGLSFQPMTGITFLINMVREGTVHGLSAGQAGLIGEAREQLESISGVGPRTAAMLFRVGTADPPSARSLRYPIDKTATFGE